MSRGRSGLLKGCIVADKLRPLSAARVRNPDAYSQAVAREVRELMAELGSLGWTLWDIAAACDCSRTALVSWRNDAADMPAKRLLRLRDVVRDNAGRRRSA